MTKVGVKALKNQLSRYLRLVCDGERIVVTDRGRPIAVLSGVEPSAAAAQAWALVDSGSATWDGGKPAGSRRPPRVRGRSAAEIVVEDRR